MATTTLDVAVKFGFPLCHLILDCEVHGMWCRYIAPEVGATGISQVFAVVEWDYLPFSLVFTPAIVDVHA